MPIVKRTGTKLNLELDEGTDYSLILTCLDVDSSAAILTGYSAELQARDSYNDMGTPELKITSPDSGMVVYPDSGTIHIDIDKTQNVFGNRKLVYDLVVTDASGEKFVWLYGTLLSRGAVTK